MINLGRSIMELKSLTNPPDLAKNLVLAALSMRGIKGDWKTFQKNQAKLAEPITTVDHAYLKKLVGATTADQAKKISQACGTLTEQLREIIDSNLTVEQANTLGSIQLEDKTSTSNSKKIIHKTITDKQRFITMNKVNNKTLLKQTSVPYFAKPTGPYEMNSPRSRLPTADFIQPQKNSSTISMGVSTKNQQKSMHQAAFRHPAKLYKFNTNEDMNSRNNIISKKNLFERY